MILEIIGVCWNGDQESGNMFPFCGALDADGKGSFKGEMEDSLGISVLEGEFDGNMLTFRKQYVNENEQIFYQLYSATVVFDNNVICSGWKGTYRSSLGAGQASCIVHPLL